MDLKRIEKAVKEILLAIGEDVNREGLVDTPKRVARMYADIFSGIKSSPGKELTVVYNEFHEEMVLLKDIPFYSMCEHHLLPFVGKAHVAYIPDNNRIVGLSKLARLVDVVSKKPQLQERLTSQIADTIMKELKPKGTLVIVQAEHLCMTMRGIKKPGSRTITSALRGNIKTDARTRAEAMTLINRK